jgi:hypothetical protein
MGIEKIFNIDLIVNILLHVTILFTILSMFFMFFIASISSDAINHELKSSIKDSFDYLKDGFDHLKEDETINNKIIDLKKEYDNLVSLYNNNELLNSETLIINAKINDILLQINNLQFLNKSMDIPITYSSLPDISYWMKNLSFDYYLNLFSNNNITRERVNNQLFTEIKIINFLLILFLIIFVGTLYFADKLTMTEFGHILLENIITFIFVGIVEIIFFLNIALKFIPVPPSLIFKSLIESLKKNLQKK